MEIVFKKKGKSLDRYFLGLFWGFILSTSLVGIFFFICLFTLCGPEYLKTYLEGPHIQELKENIKSAKFFL